MGAPLPAKSIPVFAQIEVQLSLKLIVQGLVLAKDVTVAKYSSPLKFVCRYKDLPSASSSFRHC